jgi:hypothetical protein
MKRVRTAMVQSIDRGDLAVQFVDDFVCGSLTFLTTDCLDLYVCLVSVVRTSYTISRAACGRHGLPYLRFAPSCHEYQSKHRGHEKAPAT